MWLSTLDKASESTREKGTEVKLMEALVSQHILVPLGDGTKDTGPHGDLGGNVAKMHTIQSSPKTYDFPFRKRTV